MNAKTEKIKQNTQGKENLYSGKKNPEFEWKHGTEVARIFRRCY